MEYVSASSWLDQLPYMPASPKRPASPVLLGWLYVSLTGLEVSLRYFFQDRDIERKICHQLLESGVLFLQLLEPFGLLYPHTTVLSTPTVIGLFCDSYLPAGFGSGGPLTDEDFNLS